MPQSIEEILQEAIRLVNPSKVETRHVQQIANHSIELVKRQTEKCPLETEVVLGGSFAKGTWLKNEADIDIFVKFPEDAPEDVLEKIGVNIALKAFNKYNPVLRYAEHPYVEVFIRGIGVNVVPCFNVPRGKWRSAADRSPHHSNIIIQTFDDTLKREVRLLKKFLESLGIYGAEIKIQGFSGYVSEVMIWKYGSFISTLSNATVFKEKEVICIGKADEHFHNIFSSPLIILDPVDEKRNLGTAISTENVGTFILASRRFLADPNIRFFRGPTKSPLSLRSCRSKLLDGLALITFGHKPRSPDILWGQLRRSLQHLQRQLETRGFRILRSICASDDIKKSAFIFLLESCTLCNYLDKVGPKIHMSSNLESFLEKNLTQSKLLWIENDGRVHALLNRKFCRIESVFENLLSYEARNTGLAPGLKSDVMQTHRIFCGEDALKTAERYGWLREAVLGIVRTNEWAFSRR